MAKSIIEFYFKDECGLCEEMEAELRRYLHIRHLQNRINVIKRDIEDNSGWFERYREYVPVLVIDNEEICHYFFDQLEMDIALNIGAKTK